MYGSKYGTSDSMYGISDLHLMSRTFLFFRLRVAAFA